MSNCQPHLMPYTFHAGQPGSRAILSACLGSLGLNGLLKLSGLHAGVQMRGARPCDSQSIALCHALTVLQACAAWVFASRHAAGDAATVRFLHFQAQLAAAASILSLLLLAIPHETMLGAARLLQQCKQHGALAALAAVLSAGLAAFATRTIAALTSLQGSLMHLVHPTAEQQLYLVAALAFAMVAAQRALVHKLPDTFTIGEAWLLAAGWLHALLWLGFRAASAVQYAQIRAGVGARINIEAAVHAAVHALVCPDSLPVAVTVATMGICCAAPEATIGACHALWAWLLCQAGFAGPGQARDGAQAHRMRRSSQLLGGPARAEHEASSGDSASTSRGADSSESSDEDQEDQPRHNGAVAAKGGQPLHSLQHMFLSTAASLPRALRRALPGAKRRQQRRHRGTAHAAMHLSLFAAYTVFIAAAARAALAEALASRARILLLCGWAAGIAAALPAIAALHTRQILPATLLRKLFHMVALALFVPGLLIDARLLALALGVVLSVLAALELLRLSGAPGLADALSAFMLRFTDGRDGGAAIISHLSLLAGVAVPLWLALPPAPCAAPDGISAALLRGTSLQGVSDGLRQRGTPLAAWAGLLSLGVADSAAAAIGSVLGRWRVFVGSAKSVEGCVAGAATLTVSLLLVLWCSDAVAWPPGIAAMVMVWRVAWASMLIALLEACTTQLDNLVMPVHACTLLMTLA